MAEKNGKERYADQLADLRWQERRLEILKRDNNQCSICRRSAGFDCHLHVHHSHYCSNAHGPWDYNNLVLHSLCNDCHKWVHDVATLTGKDGEQRMQHMLMRIAIIESHHSDVPSIRKELKDLVRFGMPWTLHELEELIRKEEPETGISVGDHEPGNINQRSVGEDLKNPC